MHCQCESCRGCKRCKLRGDPSVWEPIGCCGGESTVGAPALVPKGGGGAPALPRDPYILLRTADGFRMFPRGDPGRFAFVRRVVEEALHWNDPVAMVALADDLAREGFEGSAQQLRKEIARLHSVDWVRTGRDTRDARDASAMGGEMAPAPRVCDNCRLGLGRCREDGCPGCVGDRSVIGAGWESVPYGEVSKAEQTRLDALIARARSVLEPMEARLIHPKIGAPKWRDSQAYSDEEVPWIAWHSVRMALRGALRGAGWATGEACEAATAYLDAIRGVRRVGETIQRLRYAGWAGPSEPRGKTLGDYRVCDGRDKKGFLPDRDMMGADMSKSCCVNCCEGRSPCMGGACATMGALPRGSRRERFGPQPHKWMRKLIKAPTAKAKPPKVPTPLLPRPIPPRRRPITARPPWQRPIVRPIRPRMPIRPPAKPSVPPRRPPRATVPATPRPRPRGPFRPTGPRPTTRPQSTPRPPAPPRGLGRRPSPAPLAPIMGACLPGFRDVFATMGDWGPVACKSNERWVAGPWGSAGSCQAICPEGQLWFADTGCVDPKACPPGTRLDIPSRQCVPDPNYKQGQQPPPPPPPSPPSQGQTPEQLLDAIVKQGLRETGKGASGMPYGAPYRDYAKAGVAPSPWDQGFDDLPVGWGRYGGQTLAGALVEQSGAGIEKFVGQLTLLFLFPPYSIFTPERPNNVWLGSPTLGNQGWSESPPVEGEPVEAVAGPEEYDRDDPRAWPAGCVYLWHGDGSQLGMWACPLLGGADAQAGCMPGETVDPSDGACVAPDGTRYYDGAIVHPDGTIEYPDGTVEYPDGTIEYPDGTVQYADGTMQMPDGTVYLPDGSVQLPDGSVQYPDGTVQGPDGMLYGPDGQPLDGGGLEIPAPPAPGELLPWLADLLASLGIDPGALDPSQILEGAPPEWLAQILAGLGLEGLAPAVLDTGWVILYGPDGQPIVGPDGEIVAFPAPYPPEEMAARGWQLVHDEQGNVLSDETTGEPLWFTEEEASEVVRALQEWDFDTATMGAAPVSSRAIDWGRFTFSFDGNLLTGTYTVDTPSGPLVATASLTVVPAMALARQTIEAAARGLSRIEARAPGWTGTWSGDGRGVRRGPAPSRPVASAMGAAGSGEGRYVGLFNVKESYKPLDVVQTYDGYWSALRSVKPPWYASEIRAEDFPGEPRKRGESPWLPVRRRGSGWEHDPTRVVDSMGAPPPPASPKDAALQVATAVLPIAPIMDIVSMLLPTLLQRHGLQDVFPQEKFAAAQNLVQASNRGAPGPLSLLSKITQGAQQGQPQAVQAAYYVDRAARAAPPTAPLLPQPAATLPGGASTAPAPGHRSPPSTERQSPEDVALLYG